MPLDDLITGTDLAEAMTAGWRYVFSRDYRLRKKAEWRELGWTMVLLEVGFGATGICVTVIAVVLMGYWCWHRWFE